ncbi:spore germination protein [Tumebacillus sp. ITR2]|uniref:Spore germination protein n=1 Tax=Tumebacillus amylolyticus TaxID=2801339 RepID=A0ABS1JHA2_9BACL|nr:spore germination protein [Tumebacillus amylolyticus]MBL0389494.1 spore germination protein [Tumebacillus amylolyticus]
MKKIRRVKKNLRYTDALQAVERSHTEVEQQLGTSLEENEQLLKTVFQKCSDLVFHKVPTKDRGTMLAVYVDGLVDSWHLDEIVLKPLLYEGVPQGLERVQSVAELVRNESVAVGQTKTVTMTSELVLEVMRGGVALLADGSAEVLVIGLQAWEKRSLQEPVTESVIRGPREGFIENIRTNTSLLRRRIKSPRLKMETLTIGELSQTSVVVTYIEGIVSESLVQEVHRRLSDIQIDGVLESGYLEEMIEDKPFSPFPQMQYTERPDVVVGNLLEGRVAVLVDGTPNALLMPLTIWGAMHANEDYYERWMMVSLVRLIRILFLGIALLLPSLYVAITTYHQEMLPTNLLLSIAGARENSPFPALIEALIMEVTFEALREAGVRLPKPVGQAVSIVGALVIGQAAVDAAIVSAPLVIVVSITGIASFTIPRYNLSIAIRLMRFPMIFLAGTLGLFGITLGLLGLLIHLSSLRSFGTPYLYPVAPLTIESLRDVFIRAPWWSLNVRPRLTGYNDPVRIPEGQYPSPENESGKPKS